MEIPDKSGNITPLDFTRFEKNTGFPPHNHYQDSNADINSEKTGGIFTKTAKK